MATTDARPVPRKNTAFRLYFAVRKNDGTLITTWAGQDSEVSKDGGAFADCTSEATEIGTSGCGYLELTASEMNADAVVLKITVTNTDALPIVMTFFPEEQGDYRVGAVELDSATRVKLSSEQPDYAPAKSEDVNAQILNVLTVDTFQELSYPPTATSSLKDKIAWLFMWARNKVVQSTTDRKLYADDDLTIVSTESTVDGGSSFTKGKAT